MESLKRDLSVAFSGFEVPLDQSTFILIYRRHLLGSILVDFVLTPLQIDLWSDFFRDSYTTQSKYSLPFETVICVCWQGKKPSGAGNNVPQAAKLQIGPARVLFTLSIWSYIVSSEL